MPQGIDPALLMFAGRFLSQGGGDPSNGFGNALGAGLEAAGGQMAYRQEQSRLKKQDLVKSAESSIAMRKAMQEIQARETKKQSNIDFLKSLPEEQRITAAVNPEKAALIETQQANPTPITPAQQAGFDQDRAQFAQTQQLAERKFQAQQAKPAPVGPLKQVFDPNTGRTTYAPAAEAVGQQAPPKQGITIGADGTVQIGGEGLTNRTKGNVQERLIDLDNKRGRLKQISSTWKPEYNQIGSRLGLAWENLKDKANILGKPDTQAIYEFSQFKQNALNNINRTIKEITGAAMTNGEAQRIRMTEADAGQGIFDGDGPTAFKAKLDNATYTVDLVRARMGYLLHNGIDFSAKGNNAFNGVSLYEMPALIDMRGEALERQYIESGMDPREVEQLVASELQTEFGL